MTRLLLILGLLISLCPAALASALDDFLIGEDIETLSAGLAAKERGDLDNALARYTQIIESQRLDKENLAIAYNNRANVWDDKGQPDKALEDYAKALELMPKFMEAYYNRAQVWFQIGQYHRSLEDYDQALELSPFMASVHFNRSFPLAALGRYEEAVRTVEEAITLAGENEKYELQLEELRQAWRQSREETK